MRIATIFIL